jgi:hypothetical protein
MRVSSSWPGLVVFPTAHQPSIHAANGESNDGAPTQTLKTVKFKLNVNAPVFTAKGIAKSMAKTIHPSMVSSVDLMKIYYCNARSLRNNLTELQDLLYSDKFKILCFTESFLCIKFSDSLLDPKGLYAIYRRDRLSRWPAGGVCIFISKLLPSTAVEIDTQTFPETEIVSAITIFKAGVILKIVCVYIPPNLSQDLFNKSMCCIERLCSPNESIMLVGDFNLPDIDWKTMISPNTAKCKGLLNVCVSHGLTQYVEEPTRLKNILDLVFSNDNMLISDIKVEMPFGLSDHNSIIISVAMPSTVEAENLVPARKLLWSKADWSAFASYVRYIDWESLIIEGQSVDELWGITTDILRQGVDNYVPYSQINLGSKIWKIKKSKYIQRLKARKLKYWKLLKRKKTAKN